MDSRGGEEVNHPAFTGRPLSYIFALLETLGGQRRRVRSP